MEHVNLINDIDIICVKAESFPAGVMGAFDKLSSTLTEMDKRSLYGISHGSENGGIIYYAAATALASDEKDYMGLEKFTILKGNYLSEIVTDYMKHTGKIGETFRSLLAQPGIDPNGYCLERYNDNLEVECMVKLKTDKM